jgi:hypothetical protein
VQRARRRNHRRERLDGEGQDDPRTADESGGSLQRKAITTNPIPIA